jgi:hypothetical protein
VNQVGFIDAAHALDREQHDELWRRTEDQVATMLASTPGDGAARLYRNVAFVMSEEGARVLGI